MFVNKTPDGQGTRVGVIRDERGFFFGGGDGEFSYCNEVGRCFFLGIYDVCVDFEGLLVFIAAASCDKSLEIYFYFFVIPTDKRCLVVLDR